MSATFLLVALAFGQSQPEKGVTDAEKKEFLSLLVTSPTAGEFFTDEAILKAAPYTRVLLALTEKDLGKDAGYAFLALSAGLMGHKEARQYATANFGKIAHPQIKLDCAIMIFRHGTAPPEIVAYLRKALDSEQEHSFGLGPGFQDFKDQVIRTYETGRLMKVELITQHAIQAFPKFGGGCDYTNESYVFAPGALIYAVRPLSEKKHGELIKYHLANGTATRRIVPQPNGFKPKFDIPGYFHDPVLSINSRGDLLCWWTIEGNGDHGFGLLKNGADAFLVNRIGLPLSYSSRVVAAPNGSWHLIHSESAFFNVHRIDEEMKFTRLGRIRQSASLLDARFISSDIVHLLCSGVGLRSIDFDVMERKLLHNREMLQLDKSVSPRSGTIVQTSDGSLHYVWGIQNRRDAGDAKGKKTERPDELYYQAEADATTIKVSSGCHHRAIAIGDRVVVCYSQENAANQICFCVIRQGVVGPITQITVTQERRHNLWSEDIVLYAEADRIWLVNTLAPNTLHELKLVDSTKPL